MWERKLIPFLTNEKIQYIQLMQRPGFQGIILYKSTKIACQPQKALQLSQIF